jgi:hypothetical protein
MYGMVSTKIGSLLPVELVKKFCFVFKNVLKSQKKVLNRYWSSFELKLAVVSFVSSPVPNSN